MSDLPQLHADLVGAAARRGRRERLRRLVLRAAVVVLVVGAAGVWIGRAEPEIEAPAPARLSPSERLERAYGVFRRPARARDRYGGGRVSPLRKGRVLRSRLVARRGSARHFLLETPDGLCLMTTVKRRGGGGGCGPLATYLDGKRPIGSFSDEPGPSSPVFAFPDGVESVELTTDDGAVETVRVRDNAIAPRLRARLVQMTWTAPDGTPQTSDFHAAPAMDPKDFYSVLRRADEVMVAEQGDARAWIHSRGGAVCLRVTIGEEQLTGCRKKVADVRRAIVVILDGGGGPRVAAVFPDVIRSAELRFADGSRRRVTVRDNAIPLTDAVSLESIRYRSPGGHGMVSDRIPAGAEAVLNAKAG
jgi:uncharacterized protein